MLPYGNRNSARGSRRSRRPPLPRSWIGKKLVRAGQAVLPFYSGYVLEVAIRFPHIVLGPRDITPNYDPDRVIIYVDQRGFIENVRYG